MASVTVAHAFALIEALSGQSFEGLRNSQIAETTGQSASTTLRRLQDLEALGLVERIQGRDERWRLAPKIVQIAIHHQNELAQLTRRTGEFEQRYSRQP